MSGESKDDGNRRGDRAHPVSAPDVLVVDDDPDMRAYMRRCLGPLTDRVVEAADGAEALARAVGASRATLYRRLKDLLGQSPMGLIRRVRLEQAAALLEKGDGSIGEIAYAVGFRSIAHFSSSFKEHFGESPSAYRRDRREPHSRPD